MDLRPLLKMKLMLILYIHQGQAIDHFTVVFSDLALDCKRGWGWPCFDRNPQLLFICKSCCSYAN